MVGKERALVWVMPPKCQMAVIIRRLINASAANARHRAVSSSAHETMSSFNGKPKATEFRPVASGTQSPSACR